MRPSWSCDSWRPLAPGGHLILQTPNATALAKRIRMLFGRNPYDPIREESGNPGHFHEHTVDELVRAVDEAGLEVTRVLTENYSTTAHGRTGPTGPSAG